MPISFQKNYNTYLTQDLDNTSSWEIEVFLNDTPESDIWFLLINKWIVWKEDNIFYHRKLGNSVFIYWVNRTNIVTHTEWSTVSLVNSIDALNYLASRIDEQFFMYKKWSNILWVKWWTIYKDWSEITIPDLDTSDWFPGQVLIVNKTNYIYVDEWIIKITDTKDTTKYNVWYVWVSPTWDMYTIYNTKPIIFNNIEWADFSDAATIADARIAAQKWVANWLAILNWDWLISDSQLVVKKLYISIKLWIHLIPTWVYTALELLVNSPIWDTLNSINTTNNSFTAPEDWTYVIRFQEARFAIVWPVEFMLRINWSNDWETARSSYSAHTGYAWPAMETIITLTKLDVVTFFMKHSNWSDIQIQDNKDNNITIERKL